MPRYALVLEYDGTDFFGWQTQKQTPTLQATLEHAISRVANHPVEVVASGRTDTGVHALAQVVHFESAAERSTRAWLLGINSNLPKSMVVTWVGAVGEDFHARYSARLRRYRYRIANSETRPALMHRYAVHERTVLDLEAMRAAAQCLLGEHDFSSFRTVACQSPTPVRYMHRIELRRAAELIDIQLEANAFLHHMCRNIVGSLLKVGRGDVPVSWLAELLLAKNRKLAGITAPAQGLCFLGPLYPAVHSLPERLTLREQVPDHRLKDSDATNPD